MELRIKRIEPGKFSIHTEDGKVLENVEHLETRYMGDRVISHVKIVTRVKDLGRFEKAKPAAIDPKTKHTKEQSSGSESNPA